MERKLERDQQHKMIAGVCAGLANYLNIDVTVIRAIFLVSLVLHGCGILPYIILWIVMPKRIAYPFNAPGFDPTVDYTVPPQTGPVDYMVPNSPFSNAGDMPFAPKRKSNAGMVVGLALVAFGTFFLLDNFDLLPNWEFDRLWPLVLIALGALLLFSRREVKPWEKPDWNAGDKPAAETKTEDKTEDIPPTE
ncbi:PspC domain-containing protein [Mucilaginibacter panaciglaebae]|uniref:Phage shock protein C (PspC) family protein n=1 Tax=Mucilaginibacter panaciglaebae TaxID=502331 RepID=A0ABP7WRY8_9SPHI